MSNRSGTKVGQVQVQSNRLTGRTLTINPAFMKKILDIPK